MTAASPAALERFARATLGCNCAPEVFHQIEEDQVPLPGLSAPARRIAIGGRLLLYLIPITDPTATLERLPDWVAAGRAERDRRGMNRVRLVLGYATLAAAETQAIEAACVRLATGEERVHLHLIPAAALPP